MEYYFVWRLSSESSDRFAGGVRIRLGAFRRELAAFMKTWLVALRSVSWLMGVAWLPSLAVAGAPQLVTILNPAQAPADGGSADSVGPVLSPDGRYVLFGSTANNLVLIGASNALPPVGPAPLNVFLRDRTNRTTTLVSVNISGNGGGNDDSLPVAISTNGRYALFESSATNLVANDTNNASDVFVRDLVAGTTLLVSVGKNGGVGNGASQSPAMTPDGRYVAFLSGATNLVAGDTNGIPDVFVRDLQGGSTVLASVGAIWAIATKSKWPTESPPDITPDGRYVVFHTGATNLVPGVTTANDIYVSDLVGGTTIQASAGARSAVQTVFGTTNIVVFNYVFSSNGQFVAYEAKPLFGAVGLVLRYNVLNGLTDQISTNATADAVGDNPGLDMTPDGRFIAFVANTNRSLLTNTCIQVWDGLSGATTLASGDLTNGVPDGSFCDWPTLSPDGRFVAFISSATNLVTNNVAGEYHLYRHDLQSNTTTLVDADTNGVGSVLTSMPIPSMSEDGRFIAFEYVDRNLGPNSGNRAYDVFVRDISLGATELISPRDPALPSFAGNGPSMVSGQAFSADGRYVVYVSEANNLVANDTNAAQDVFVRDLFVGTNILVSVSTNGISPGDNISRDPAMSSSGRYVVFSSTADNLMAGDNNLAEDVFIRDLQAGTTSLVSVNTNGTGPGNAASYSPFISSDGRFVLFRSKATNLAPGAFNNSENLFLRDLQWGTNVALTTSGVAFSAMTPDGHFVAYFSMISTPLYDWDSQLAQRVYTNNTITSLNSLITLHPDGIRLLYAANDGLHGLDRVANTNWLVSSNRLAGSPGLHFSADGRFLTYAGASVSVPIVTNQVYLYDFLGGTNLLVSRSWNSSSPAAASSDSPDISADGRFVAYRSKAPNVVPDDFNGQPDLFVFDRVAGSTTVVTASRLGTQTGNNRSLSPVFGGNSQTLIFETWACDVAMPASFNFSSSLAVLNVAFSNSIVPFSTLIMTAPQGPVLSWPAAAGRTYVVQFKNNLGDATWVSLGGSVTILDGTAYFQDQTSAGTQRFYRVAAY
jgi:hypothetical protein